MFCKICENFMDITNNVSNINTETNQIGGNSNKILEDSSSDYDLTTSNIDNSTISDDNINNILSGSDIDIDLKKFNILDLNKNVTFNKLSNNQKTLVINRILEKIPKNTKLNKLPETSINKDSYFYCKSCGYFEEIPKKMFIFSRGDEKKDDVANLNFKQYKYDNTLPYTINYNCINENCSTHKNPNIKMAVFFRQKGTYNIKYVCSICDSFWNTFIEK